MGRANADFVRDWLRQCDEQIRPEVDGDVVAAGLACGDDGGNPERGKQFFTHFGLEAGSYDEELFQFDLDKMTGRTTVTRRRTWVWPKFAEFGKWKSSSPLHAMVGRLCGGVFSGPVEMYFCDGTAAKSVFRDGEACGFSVRYFEGEIIWVGELQSGMPVGHCLAREWEGGGVLLGQVDERGEQTGECVYLYPDMDTALVGRFVNTVMESARPAKVTGLRVERNMLRVNFKLLHFGYDISYKFAPILPNSVIEDPLLRDLYEDKQVEVRRSSMTGGGEGVFARDDDIPPDTLVAIFNGVRHPLCSNLIKGVVDDEEIYWRLSYNIHMPENEDYFLDIPPHMRSLTTYSASLGHKVNHSFLPNCDFSTMFHPRWGRIRTVVSKTLIRQGEELFVDYGYDLVRCPDWYRDLWKQQSSLVQQQSRLV